MRSRILIYNENLHLFGLSMSTAAVRFLYLMSGKCERALLASFAVQLYFEILHLMLRPIHFLVAPAVYSLAERRSYDALKPSIGYGEFNSPKMGSIWQEGEPCWLHILHHGQVICF